MKVEIPTEEQIRGLGWNSIDRTGGWNTLMPVAQQLTYISLLLLAIHEKMDEVAVK